MKTKPAKWTVFEDDVERHIKRSLHYGLLPFTGEAKVKRSASYETPDGMRTIDIEVALEAYRRDADEPFFVWLWECKHKSNRKVEVGVVRELHSKICDLGVGRFAGSVVTTIGFQSGAITLAKNLGISLYTLSIELVPVLRYSRDAPDGFREMIFAMEAIGFNGELTHNERFDDVVRMGLRRHVEQIAS